MPRLVFKIQKNFDLEDKPITGKPRELEDEALEELLEEDDTQTELELARQLGVDTSTVSRHLRKLGKFG